MRKLLRRGVFSAFLTEFLPRRKSFVANSCVIASRKNKFLFFAFLICLYFEISCTLMKKVMKRSYHICISGGDEVIFRSEDDYHRAFNCLALAVCETDSSLMAEAIMSTHSHICARTDRPDELVRSFRYPYARYFNNKYKRRGRLGEKTVFTLQLDGLYHRLSALSYVLRNPVHHGVAPTPYAYPHSSACALFKHALGRNIREQFLSRRYYNRFLPSRAETPESYKMNSSGVFVRESVIDVIDVEHMFSTPRAYLYYMNRLSGEEWRKEQEKDKNDMPPITLEQVEAGVSMTDLSVMLSNENGRFDINAITDIQLCELIDTDLLSRYGVTSVYELSRNKKESLGNYLCSTYRLAKQQVSRCLAY